MQYAEYYPGAPVIVIWICAHGKYDREINIEYLDSEGF
jgi:hypothetical protein